MLSIARRHLEADLTRILRDSDVPLSLEQLVHQLFFVRQRTSDLLVLSRASIRRKQRLKIRIARTLAAGAFVKVGGGATPRYALAPNAAEDPLSKRHRRVWHAAFELLFLPILRLR